jgi:class 3 adenylate cyclase
MERRLVTIMAADVVGYSTRMELSESETIRQLSALTQMIGEQVIRYNGRVFFQGRRWLPVRISKPSYGCASWI